MTEAAWHVFGVGIGQAEVLEFGVATGIVVIVGYRFMSRGKRYGK
jgi:hypothetical protein